MSLQIRPATLQTTAYKPTENRLFKASSVVPIQTPTGLKMRIDGAYDMNFPKSSDVAKQYEMGTAPELLVRPYVGGTFHVVDEQIIDHRKNDYKGYIHTEAAVRELSNRIGFVKSSSNSEIVARNTTSKFEHSAFNSSGGQFDVDIGFNWSAFSPNVESHFEMVRALCENQMIFGKGTVMSRTVPIINNWESNMEVANHVLKRIFETTISQRLADMPSERINLADVKLLGHQIESVLASDKIQKQARAFVNNIKAKLSPIIEMPGMRSLALNDLKRIASPVSVFDAFNIATEMTSHYMPEDVSSSKLQAFSNSCIFDRKRQMNIASESMDCVSDTFNDADTAFFAETCH
jgi:hypothetical protein